MASQPKHDESHKEAEEDAGPSKMDRFRTLLKKAAHYAMLGLTPLIAIIALIVAVMAFSANRSSQAQLTATLGKLDAANAALKASKTELFTMKTELSSLKAEIAQHKTQQEEARKNQEALDEKIVQNVSRAQAKLKVTPTLEEQLKPHASPAAALPAPSVKATAAAPATPKQTSPQVQAIKEAIQQFNKKR